jgi:dolichol-phosphate mannosyltransferase
VWTFEDRDFSTSHTIKQFILFVGISSFGAATQLILVYILVESGLRYEISLVLAVSVASISNFLLNKKLTFKDKIWG